MTTSIYTHLLSKQVADAHNADKCNALWTQHTFDTTYFGHNIPWTQHTLDKTYFGHIIPWTQHTLDTTLYWDATYLWLNIFWTQHIIYLHDTIYLQHYLSSIAIYMIYCHIYDSLPYMWCIAICMIHCHICDALPYVWFNDPSTIKMHCSSRSRICCAIPQLKMQHCYSSYLR